MAFKLCVVQLFGLKKVISSGSEKIGGGILGAGKTGKCCPMGREEFEIEVPWVGQNSP